VLAAQGQELRLCANKVNVVNAMDANMFIVFANKKIGNAVSIIREKSNRAYKPRYLYPILKHRKKLLHLL
jgi:hypothetical protein